MYQKTCLRMVPKIFVRKASTFYSKTELKENFLEALKEVKDYNRGQEFCQLLLDAKTAIHKSESIPRDESSFHPSAMTSFNKNQLDTHLIIYKLQDMIHKDKPDNSLANIITESMLRWNGEERMNKESRRLTLLFLNFDVFQFGNPRCHSSREYLKHFIDDVEFFIWSNIDENAWDFSSRTKETLKKLEYKLFKAASASVSSLSWKIGEIIDTQHSFSEEEEKEFQALMTEAIPQILTLLSRLIKASQFVVPSRNLAVSNEYETELQETFLRQMNYCNSFLDRVSLFHLTYKEKLFKYIKDGISFSNAYKVFEILSELESSLTTPGRKSLNTDLVINQLKDLINAEKPENLVNIILEERDVSKNKASELVLLLSDVANFDFLKPKYNNSKEYLMHFIQELRYLIDIQETFTGFKYELFYKTRHITGDLLDTIFKIYVCQLPLSEEDLKKFSALMSETISFISEFADSGSHYKIKSHVLRKRSSLEFFKDFCYSISANGKTSLTTFDLDKLNRPIRTLDKAIIIMCYYSANEGDWPEHEYLDDDYANGVYLKNDNLDEFNFDDDCVDDDWSDGASELEDDGAKMPKSHTWWAKCLEILNNKKLKKSQT